MILSGKPNIDVKWHRTRLSADRLDELNERSDFKGAVQTLGFLGIVCLTAAGVFYTWQTQQWWLFALFLFLHGTVTSFYINGVHELIHGTVFKTKAFNVFFAHVFGFLGVVNHRMFWYSHTEHHKYTLHPPDDLEVIVPQYYSTGSFFKTALIDLSFWLPFTTQLRYCFGKFVGDWEPVIIAEGSGNRKQRVVNWSRFLIIGHVSIAAVSIFYGLWIIPILLSLTHAYANWLFFLCNSTQHVGLVENVDDFRLNCRTFYLNPIIRFIYWHMNWHIEHHMYAAVPCYNLRKLHNEIKHSLPRCPNGLVETWVEIAYIQFRQRENPDFRFVAELPDEEGAFLSNESRLKRIRQQANSHAAQKYSKSANGRRWECSICGFIYSEVDGLPEEGIAPGTPWEAIPDDWACPDCGVSKAEFDMVELVDREPMPTSGNEKRERGDSNPIVVVGTGLSGYGFVKEFRKLDQETPVVMITQDDGRFYTKPMLSNALSKRITTVNLTKASASEMEQQLDVVIHTKLAIQAIDREQGCVKTANGSINYSKLVLATGASPIRLPLNGSAVNCVRSINDLMDYEAFLKELPERGKVVILGAGLIGCELANDLVLAGHGVEVIDLAERPLGRLVPEAVGKALETKLSEQGVRWHFGVSVQSVDESSGAAPSAFSLLLSDGGSIEADIVLSAVGLQSRTALAHDAGLKCGKGVVVDEKLQTSDPCIYALGDCAEVFGEVRPYVMPISLGARALAQTLAGSVTAVKYPVMPVVVKTPSLPLVAVPPPLQSEGCWEVEGEACELTARFVDVNGVVAGFALSGDACERKAEMLNMMHTQLA